MTTSRMRKTRDDDDDVRSDDEEHHRLGLCSKVKFFLGQKTAR